MKKIIISISIIILIGTGIFLYNKLKLSAGQSYSINPNSKNWVSCKYGLKSIGNYEVPASISKNECIDYIKIGGSSICSDCVNQTCEEWEHICNCPEDCE